MATNQIGHIEPFEIGSDDWELYAERLEQFMLANGIDDDKKKVAVFVTVIGAKAYALLRNLVAPTKPHEQKYEDLVEAMKSHLKPKPLTIAERFKFNRRKQQGESIAQFLAELRKLAETCNFGAKLDEQLRDRMVEGLRSESVQKRLLAERDITLTKAYELATSMETASREASGMHATAIGTATVKQVAHVAPQKKPSCYRCGKSGHSPDQCYYKKLICRACGKRGHIARACNNPKGSGTRKPGNFKGKRQSKGQGTHHVDENTDSRESSPGSDLPMFNMGTVKGSAEGSIKVDVQVNGVSIEMELDTGAACSIISKETWKRSLSTLALGKADLSLITYTGERLKVLGQVEVQVEYEGQGSSLPLIVVDGNGPSLFGRNWLSKIRLNWMGIKQVTTGVDHLLRKYKDVFRNELGTLKGIDVPLVVQENATPKFFKPRSVPYAIHGAIEKDLERLESLGVIEKVNYSDWAAPIVPVPKADGSIRICGDYKVTVNPVLKVDQFPVPKPEDLFASLTGGKKFTKLDLSHAYQQVLLEPESRKYVTINTHKGLYRYNRLPFGIANAPAIFQQTMEKILQGLPMVVVYIDDILISGRTNEEHLDNLEKVLQRLQQYGLRLKQEKCSFLQSSVEYLGYIIDAEGLHATPDKIDAIVNAPQPESVQELRSFLGLVNYYGKFIKNLSTLAHPLNNLLRHSTQWNWNHECETAFQQLKQKLASADVLVHYDTNLPLKLACDASAYGVGAVISHIFPNGEERPIAYASRTLTSSESNYAQIEKEALGLIFGVKRFHQFLYGRKFVLVTDHKPLTTILHPAKGLPTLAAARMQRWAMLLTAYQYDIEFRSTSEHANADGFSRLPIPATNKGEGSATVASMFNLNQINVLPLGARQLKQATEADPVLMKVLLYTQKGWPEEIEPEFRPYYRRRNELTVEGGCLLCGMRVVVPTSCQTKVLEELHTSHPGIVKMKSLARIHVWWPSIDQHIEKMVQNCGSCQSVRNRPATALLHPWSWPDRPWMRIHVDFAGPFQGAMFMVVVDANSKWLEVIPMSSTTTEKTIAVLRNLFASYGLPEQLVSDNGPQFTSTEFADFMKSNGIKHIRTAPYHPSSNGEAERFVQTFKHALKAGKNDKGTLHQKLTRFLLTYRSTPHSTTGVSPAELFLKRQLRTRLDLLRPSLEKRVATKQAKQKSYHDAHSKDREFGVGQTVLARNLQGEPKWLQGTVIEQTGPVSLEFK